MAAYGKRWAKPEGEELRVRGDSLWPIFDLDGVLVDSTPAVINMWNKWAERHDMDPGHILEAAHGRRTVETIRIIAPQLDAEAEAQELESMEVENLEGVYKIDGAWELLSSIPDNQWAVVTSGTRTLATSRMKHTGLPLPSILVSAEDVTNGKPDPEVYIRGAHNIGFSPEECLVVEDAPAGISAAKSAGMKVVAVATTHRKDELTEADVVVESVADVRFDVESEAETPDEPEGSYLRVWTG